MDDDLRRLERAALSSPDDMESFLRWKAALRRSRGPEPAGRLTGMGCVTLTADNATNVYSVADEAVVLVDASRMSMAIRLPRASESRGRFVIVKKLDGSVNPVSVIGLDGDLVADTHGVVLARQFESRELVCDGVSWWDPTSQARLAGLGLVTPPVFQLEE